MSNAKSVLRELVRLSRRLGEPERDLAILGEGNTSARCDDGTFWVKASGTQLRTIAEEGFVRLWLEPVRALAEGPDLDDVALKQALDAAKVDPTVAQRPSVETVLHALALAEAGASFVGHTHPVAVNAVACSVGAGQALSGRLFPDEIVVCGPAPLYIPYANPGLALARAVREGFRRYRAEWGQPPRVVVMQNHGLIALGSTAEEVDSLTAMTVKVCRILAGTYAFGGPRFLSPEEVEHIHTRPDEAYRRKQLGLWQAPGKKGPDDATTG
jgi:rhamnose utilization protein RhaD (predicted bifunctional aldolase and dehydrogenase)